MGANSATSKKRYFFCFPVGGAGEFYFLALLWLAFWISAVLWEMTCIPWGSGHLLRDQLTWISGPHACGRIWWTMGFWASEISVLCCLNCPRCPCWGQLQRVGAGWAWSGLWWICGFVFPQQWWLPNLSCLTSVSPLLSLGLAAVFICHSATVSSIFRAIAVLLFNLTLTCAVSFGVLV